MKLYDYELKTQKPFHNYFLAAVHQNLIRIFGWHDVFWHHDFSDSKIEFWNFMTDNGLGSIVSIYSILSFEQTKSVLIFYVCN